MPRQATIREGDNRARLCYLSIPYSVNLLILQMHIPLEQGPHNSGRCTALAPINISQHAAGMQRE